MNKVILAGLALVLVRDCDIGGPRFHGPIKGTWGGENAGLIAFDTTAHVHIGCTAGDTKQALVADEQGRFDAPGRSEEHTSELQSLAYLVCRLLLEKKKHT